MTRGGPRRPRPAAGAGRAAVWIVAALAATLAAPAGRAHAQAVIRIGDSTDVVRRAVTFPAVRVPLGRSAPLDPAVQARLARARGLALSGRPEAARDTLARLLAVAPHHPAILHELAQIHVGRSDWKALEQLARAERSAARDSLLLAPEYVIALDRLGRVRDAVEVVLQARLAAPAAAAWSESELLRLAAASPREAGPVVKQAALARPQDGGLVRIAAGLEWRADPRAALALLAAADRGRSGTPVRWTFAEERLGRATGADSAAAAEVLLELAGDTGLDPAYRLPAARRAWSILRRDPAGSGVQRVARALHDLPPDRWGEDLVLQITRGLREAGLTADARALAGRAGGAVAASPELALEGALTDLRERPDDRALAALERIAPRSPEGGLQYAEALFFAGRIDSALAWYRRVSTDPRSPATGPALERLFLLEDGEPRTALPEVGRLAYEEWRGDRRQAAVLAESLMAGLPRGNLWAHAALTLARLRESAGDGRAALAPLLAVADSLPADRLAPLACQRAGDVLRVWYKDDARALARYEDCLARYPRAWNAPEVRRRVETLRRERRF